MYMYHNIYGMILGKEDGIIYHRTIYVIVFGAHSIHTQHIYIDIYMHTHIAYTCKASHTHGRCAIRRSSPTWISPHTHIQIAMLYSAPE